MLSNFELALIDLDGTLYRGGSVIPGAPEFVRRLHRQGVRPVYFTNNSTKTPEQVAAHLRGMQFDADPADVCTSAQAAAAITRGRLKANTRVVYVGMEGVRTALVDVGLDPVDAASTEAGHLGNVGAAVMGLHSAITFSHLAHFCQQVQHLGEFVLTNGDLRLPVEQGFWPGNGAFGHLVTIATGVQPIVAGKPEVSFVDYALKRYGAVRERTVIIGDNVMTDIQAGRRAGLFTIQVMSGVPVKATNQAEDPDLPRADVYFESVDEIE